MSMHLEGPWLSTTGKKRGKFKFRNAQEAKKARDLDASWKELLKQQGIEAEEKKRKEEEDEQLAWAIGIVAIVMLLGAVGWIIGEVSDHCARVRCGR